MPPRFEMSRAVADLPMMAHRVVERARNFRPRQLLSATTAIIAVWVLVLSWGERWVFQSSLDECQWHRWEKWPSGASPYHVALIADPQLVDPHTYPGRPWPLSMLTRWYTDLYMLRSFDRILNTAYPDSVLFLGDLFDGGREWATSTTTSPESRYRGYTSDYWLGEYRRFGRIFFEPFERLSQKTTTLQAGRRFIASLPGNHDLGIGSGIQIPVRRRFNAYFGEGNRVDILGNHSFVSVDTVSLSALGQADGASGTIYESHPDAFKDMVKEVSLPTEQFLADVKQIKARATARELRRQRGENSPRFDHRMFDLKSEEAAPVAAPEFNELPSILLTHVPLYRPPGTPCGPQRERYPPSKGEPENDPRNAISVVKGYQYQNVLTPEISAELLEKIGNVGNVFSGDDHDYCEVVHKGYTGRGTGVHEITVKSISWAMGVRKPGFQLLSLWNPVDRNGVSLAGDVTAQSKMCLLPNQLSIFIRYGILFGLTVVVVLVRTLLFPKPVEQSLLPVYEKVKAEDPSHEYELNARSTGSNGLLARGRQARSSSPGSGYGFRTSSEAPAKVDVGAGSSTRRRRGVKGILREAFETLRFIACVVMAYYVYLWRSI